jgi:DNA invertase Pin-like site-specific DNA recombinase
MSLIPPRRPLAWGYARVSDAKQIVQDDSIPFQVERIEAYYKFRLAPMGVDFGGIEFDMQGVSASKKTFARRKSGAKLINLLQAGDHFIVDKFDRLWRRLDDFANLLRWFQNNEITLHFVNTPMGLVDTSTGSGILLLQITAIFAELESRQTSERVMAHNRQARKSGRAVSPKPPPGCRNYKKRCGDGKWRTYIEWDPEKRALMKKIVEMHDIQGISFDKISQSIERDLAHKHGRNFSKSAFYKRKWDASSVQKAYFSEKFYTDMNITLVTEIPLDLNRRLRQHGIDMNYIHPRKKPQQAAYLS